MQRAKAINGDKFDYSNIKEEDIKNARSIVKIFCKVEDHGVFEQGVSTHLNHKRGCPKCSLNKYTLSNFIKKAKIVHGEQYDYSNVKQKDIKNINSKVNIFCKIDGHGVFKQSVNNHINCKSRCPKCSEKAKWTLSKFIEKAKVVHADKFDYSNIKEEDIKGRSCKVNILCKVDGHGFFNPTINNHIYNKSGCTKCSGKEKWSGNLERFLDKAKNIHGDKYDLSMINKESVVNSSSIIYVICPMHNASYLFKTTITSFLQGHGCNHKDCVKKAKSLSFKLNRKKNTNGTI